MAKWWVSGSGLQEARGEIPGDVGRTRTFLKVRILGKFSTHRVEKEGVGCRKRRPSVLDPERKVSGD